MKKAGKILIIALIAVVCLSAFGGGISKVIGGISPGGGGVAIAGNATSEPFTTKANREPSKFRIKYYDKSVDEQPYIPPDLTPDFGDVTWSTIEELKSAAIQNSTDPAYCKINTKEDLVALGDYVIDGSRTHDVHFVQTANIDLSSVSDIWPIGADDFPFSGAYYGCGFRIYHHPSCSDTDWQGLFGYCSGANISGVYLSDFQRTAGNGVAGLCSYAGNTTFSNCYIEDAVFSGTGSFKKYACLLAAAGDLVKIEYCRVFNSNLNCPAFVGYVAAEGEHFDSGILTTFDGVLSLRGCVNEAEITNAEFAAPFVGEMNEMTEVSLLLCTNFGDVSGSSDCYSAGGFVGMIPDYHLSFSASACVNYGDITSLKYAGGLAGGYGGQLLEMYNFVNYGKITGGVAAGGLIGRMSLEGGNVNFESNVSAGEVVCEDGYAGAFFGTFNIDQEGSGTLFSSGEDVRTLYNFAVPGVDFIGYLSYEGAAATDAQKTALGNNHFFYHNLRVPQDPETLKDGDDADLLFYGFLCENGTYGFYYSGERFYPGIKSDSGWEFCQHQVAVWGYDDE